MNHNPGIVRSRINAATVGTVLLVVLLLGLAVHPALAGPTPKSEKGKLTFDRYYSVEMQGKHIGWARTAIRKSSDEIATMTYVRMLIRSMNRDMQMIYRSVSRETSAGELISAESLLIAGTTRVTKTAIQQGDELVITTEIFGRRAVERFDIPEGGFLSEVAAERISRDLLDQPGRRVEAVILSLESSTNPFVPVSMEVIGPETIEAFGQVAAATKVISTATMDGLKISSVSWVDTDGPLLSRSDLGGLSLLLRAADEAHAKRKPGKSPLDDLSGVTPRVPLKNPSQATRAVYRLKLRNTSLGMIDLPETDMQKVIAVGSDYVDLQVTRQNPTELAAVYSHQVPPELSEYLRSSLYLDWKTPSVNEAARKIEAASDKPWDLALALWKYVDRTIFIKNFDVYFDPASNVLASHKGDCTEHAVLLAALARARGLPSRLVTGLTQVPAGPGRSAVFGYHAWTEVWIAGKWVALDAALAQAPVDVSHIAMNVTPLNAPNPPAAAGTALLKTVGNLEIEVLEQD